MEKWGDESRGSGDEERASIDLEGVFTRFRRPLIVATNLALVALSLWLALCFRFDFDQTAILTSQRLLIPALLLMLCRAASYGYWQLNQGYWRYVSTRDAVELVKAHFVSSVIFATTIFLLQVEGFPRSVLVLEFFLSVLLAGGSRVLVRMGSEYLIQRAEGDAGAELREVVVLGAGASGHLVVKMLLAQRRLGYRPVAVLDDSEHLLGMSVSGVRVEGPISALKSFIDRHPHVSAVILAIPSFSPQRFEELSAECKQAGISLKRVQSFEEIACLDAQAPRRGASIEALLDKETEVKHETEIQAALHGKSVLVTGGGGSIGSELVRQVLRFAPGELVVFDNSEFNLFKISQELSAVRSSTRTRLTFCLGSILDEQRLLSVMKQHKPHFVFHAAAYKHVPLLEDNLYEAFRNNIVGTRNVLQVSTLAGVEKMVLISSDKAVDPASIMGCTKRIAELLTRACSSTNAAISTAVVRFGNVINSAGSVIPLFKEQILSGGPLTVTHPEMERYFMSIREAVRLVLTAGTLGERGEIYILNMGKPIKIVDVARKMLALYGRRDIPIVYTGVRPGEKLKEELTATFEQHEGTRFEKVSKATGIENLESNPFKWVADIESRLEGMSEGDIREVITQFARQSYVHGLRDSGAARSASVA